MIRIFVVLVAVFCTGCLGSALKSDREAPEIFRLTAPAPTGAGATLPIALAVGRPRAPVSLDTDRIATVQAERQFDYYAGVRWAEPAPMMLQQLLVGALAADGRFATVIASPSRVPSEYLLDIELRQFEAVDVGAAAPTVHVRLQATLLDSRGGTRLASFIAESAAVASENRRAAIVAAFDDATRTAIEAVVAGVRKGSEIAAP